MFFPAFGTFIQLPQGGRSIVISKIIIKNRGKFEKCLMRSGKKKGPGKRLEGGWEKAAGIKKPAVKAGCVFYSMT
jgi:hypothetical protein